MAHKHKSVQPLRILAVVDGSQGTGRVLKYLLDQCLGGEGMEVVLLNIQPEPTEWRMRGYGWFKREATRDRLINDIGERVVTSAGRSLDAAGIKHKDRIELGRPTETIPRCAREEDCDLILMAQLDLGAIRRWLMRTTSVSIGSVASIVIHLADIPVVVVR
jgi:nucleotide-binding universal stress UspA family protein